MTPYAEVIGDPIAHSKSPVIHGFWLDELGIEADYRKTHVPVSELGDFLARRRLDPEWRGCNVTIPHKVEVLPFLDAIDPAAAEIGAANVVVATPDGLKGYNTDAMGFLEPLKSLLDDAHLLRTARIFGAGGAARAIAHALNSRGFHLIIAARREAAAAELAAHFKDAHATELSRFALPITFDWGDLDQRLDLIVNATSLGMTGQPPLDLDFSNVPPGAVIYDAVYAPLETPLIQEARARDHPVIDGLSMLIGQARVAFELFFGLMPPSDRDSDARLRVRLTA